MIRDITIKPALNGFIVHVGCQQLVFDSIDKLLSALGAYLKNPDGVEGFWLEKGLNAKHTVARGMLSLPGVSGNCFIPSSGPYVPASPHEIHRLNVVPCRPLGGTTPRRSKPVKTSGRAV